MFVCFAFMFFFVCLYEYCVFVFDDGGVFECFFEEFVCWYDCLFCCKFGEVGWCVFDFIGEKMEFWCVGVCEVMWFVCFEKVECFGCLCDLMVYEDFGDIWYLRIFCFVVVYVFSLLVI